jgi:hypothetical protein
VNVDFSFPILYFKIEVIAKIIDGGIRRGFFFPRIKSTGYIQNQFPTRMSTSTLTPQPMKVAIIN